MSEESWLWEGESSPLNTDSSSEWTGDESIFEDVTQTDEKPAVVSSRSALATQLLNDLEEYMKKEDSFSGGWFDEKLTLPVLEDLASPAEEPTALLPFNTLIHLPVIQPVKEECVLDLGLGQLTPPQSPPAPNLTTNGHSIVFVNEASFLSLQPSTVEVELIPDSFVIPPNPPDLEQEMAMVDAVVRGAAQEFEQWDTSDSNSRSSDNTEDSDDPEWMPSEPPVMQTPRRGRQPRPYNLDDRRMRKKEQNKTAATRYRQKKKAEVSEIVEEERELETINGELKTKVTDLNREISYLKGLMREMFRAKKLI